MSLVSIRDVRKSFGQNEVLKGVSLDIAKGDVVAIIGRSGSPTASKSAAPPPICASCAAMSAWCSSSSTCFRI